MPGFLNDLRGKPNQLNFPNQPTESKRTANAKEGSEPRKNEAEGTSETRTARTNSIYLYSKTSTVPTSMYEFINEIHGIDRITGKQEYSLGEAVQSAELLKTLRGRTADSLGRGPTEEEWAKAGGITVEELKGALKEGLEAKNLLVTSNLRLVQRVVNVYIRNGLTSRYNAGDLMQEGTVALIRAAEKYQPSKGFKFSTYAMFWIRAAVKRCQLAQSREISVPAKVYDTHRKFEVMKKQMNEATGRTPTLPEIAERIDIKPKTLSNSVKAMQQRVFSLDDTVFTSKKMGSSGGSSALGSFMHYVESKVDDFDSYVRARAERERSARRGELTESTGEALFERAPPVLTRSLWSHLLALVSLARPVLTLAFLQPVYPRSPLIHSCSQDTVTNLFREDLLRHLRVVLKPERAEMIIMRFGLESGENFGEGLSVADLADKVNMKQDKVRRLIKSSLRTLRPHMIDDWY